MKSLSGSCETEAYVFLISLFRSWTSMSTSIATSGARFGLAQALEGEEGPDDEDGRRQVDQAEVPDRGETPRIVRRESDCEGQDGCCHRGSPGPHVAATNAEPGERGDRETG